MAVITRCYQLGSIIIYLFLINFASISQKEGIFMFFYEHEYEFLMDKKVEARIRFCV